jgi:para-nitrobenzyl esterase
MKKTLLTIAFLACFLQILAQSNLVKTNNGTIEGYENQGLRIFKGIPFAAPPLGELRWKAPQPVQNWDGVKKCTTFSASPMQANPTPFMCWSEEFLIPKEHISEDCLYLNVWTGAKSTKEKRPVLVYIYGGGFRSGGAACPIYDGEAIAKKGVVFVSINYRVGVFGFLAHPELSKESGHNASGNYALMDMISALQWVHENIEAFGGDAKNVTIAGQSAGAFAVNYLVASPLTKGLIHQAIAESGGSFYKNPLRPDVDMKGAEEMGIKFAKSLSLSALRAKSSEEIQKSQGGLSSPIVDGYVMPEGIFEIFSQGKQNDIPTIVGWNEDDRVSGPPVKAEIFKEQIRKRFGNHADDFFKVYPVETEEQSAQSQIALGRDELFGLQDYTWAKMQTKTGKSKAFIYNFNRKLPAYTPETQFGAFHTGEVPYAYNNLHTVKRPWEAIDYKIADMMSSYWVNFAKTGNPNGKELPVWETYQSATEQVMIIDKLSGSKEFPSKAQMAFWENYYTSK